MFAPMIAMLAASISLTTVLLLSLRIGALLLLTPVLSPAAVPLVVRVLCVLGLAAALSLGLSAARGRDAIDYTTAALVQAACIELALGATLAVGVHLAFSAFAMAGRLLDIQIGFGLSQVFDPASNASQPILSTVFNQAGMMVFFLIDGHHALLRGLAFSLERFPLGQPWPIDAALLPVIRQVAGLMGLSFALAAPVVFCLLVVEFALGVLARSLPQMNMLSTGIPIKIVAGLVALSLWFGDTGAAMGRVYAGIYQCWDALFAAPAPPTLPMPARPR